MTAVLVALRGPKGLEVRVRSSQHATLREAQEAALAALGRDPPWAGIYETMFGFIWRDDDALDLADGAPLVSVWDAEHGAWRAPRARER